MQTIRKSADGNLIIVKRSTGYAVSLRNSRWANDVKFRGTQVMEWTTLATGLTKDQAEALFWLHANAMEAA